MINIPDYLQTRQDFDNLHSRIVVGKSRPRKAELLKEYQALLNGRKEYFYDRDLDADEDPDGAEPEYRVVSGIDDETQQEFRKQYRLQDNPSARIVKLGFTAVEIEQRINELEGI